MAIRNDFMEEWKRLSWSEYESFYSLDKMTTASIPVGIEMLKNQKGVNENIFRCVLNRFVALYEYDAKPLELTGGYVLMNMRNKGLIVRRFDTGEAVKPLYCNAYVTFADNMAYHKKPIIDLIVDRHKQRRKFEKLKPFHDIFHPLNLSVANTPMEII
jgi:hypothetical protein